MWSRATIVAMALVVIGAVTGHLVAANVTAGFFARKAIAQPAVADDSQIPKPDPAFKGKIGETYKESTPDYPANRCEGVIACSGGVSGGWTFYGKEGKLAFHYNFADFEFYNVNAAEALPPGKATVKLEYRSKGTPKGSTISDGAFVKLFVNGKQVAEGETKKAMFRHGVEPFEIGRDSISSVNAAYKAKGEFAFSGEINKFHFEITPTKVSAADRERLQEISAALRDER